MQDLRDVDVAPPSPAATAATANLATAAAGLRVAVVTETWPPEVNGVSVTIARIVQGLHARGHDIELVRPRQRHERIEPQAGGLTESPSPQGTPQERWSERLMPGLPVPRYPDLTMGLPCARALRQAWTLRRPDIVHLVTEGPLGWSALRAARALKLPVVSDFRTNFHAYSRHYGLAWLRGPVMAWLRHFHNATACTMVPTEALKSALGAQGLQRLQVVARGVDTHQFSPARRSLALRASWGAGPSDTVALCVGRLAPEKNLGLVLDAVESMRQHDPRLKLVLVGDGPMRTALQSRHPQVLFSGLRRGEDLAMHYASADLFLFASTTETWGNVVPEAMASGLAVVGYDYAAASQLVRHGESGLLARFDERVEFLRMAVVLAGDIERIRALGRKARDVALRQDWGRIVGLVEAEYERALHRTDAAMTGRAADMRHTG